MADLDATFRPYVVAGFLLVILIAVPFRLKSQATGEQLDRTQEGVAMMIVLRLGGLALWAGVIAFMIDPALMAWSSISLPPGARWTGVGLTIVTAVLLTWTLRSLGPNLTDTVVTRAAHTLVTRGPYRWVRHPFYDCMALFMFSLALMMANWFVIAAGIVTFVLLAFRSRTEEDRLLERFGEPYRTYRAATGRFLPKISASPRFAHVDCVVRKRTMTMPQQTDRPRMNRTALMLGLLFLLDLGYMGQGLLSLFVAVAGLTTLTLACVWSLIRGQRPLAGSRAARAALYLLLGAATLGAMRFHARTARVNADRVIEACRSYERAHGQLPERLEDLVPAFLPAVPRAKYTGMYGEFTYWSSATSHRLLYVALPPFGRRLYHFEEDRWGQLD